MACVEKVDNFKMNKQFKLIVLIAFVLIELAILVITLSIKSDVVPIFQFSAIVLAFAFSLFFFSFKRKNFITQFALLFTVVADIFLVLLSPKNQIMAMISFSITQILYFVRLVMETKSKKIRIANLVSRIVAIVVVQIVALMVLKIKADFLSCISIFYFTNLVVNMVFAFVNVKHNPLFAIGLLLFMFCDILVGMQSAIGVYINVDPSSFIYQLAFSPFEWLWLFYIPSQTLIALSTMKINKPTKNQVEEGN